MTFLHFEATGAGRPVLALHGFGGSLFSWRHLPAALPGRRVIRVDLPGHGGSPPLPGRACGPVEHSALLAEFIEEHGLEGVDLIGHSFGGGVALLAALDLNERRPGAVGSLILVDSLALPQPLPLFMQPVKAPRLASLALSLTPPRWIVGAVLRALFHEPSRIERSAVEAYARNFATSESRRALIETALRMIPDDLPDIVARYETLRLPTLLIWGRHDWVVPLRIGQALETMIEEAKLCVIDDCGHVPQEERPEETLPLIAEFLARLA